MVATRALISVGLQDGAGNPLNNPAENGLVWLPFRRQDLAGTVTTPSGGTAFPESNDGTMTGLFYSVAASSTWATTGTTEFAFNGRKIRASHQPERLRRSHRLMIDKVAIPVPYGKFYVPETQAAFSASTPIEVILADRSVGWRASRQIIVPSSTVAARIGWHSRLCLRGQVQPAPRPRGLRYSREPVALTTSYVAQGPSDVKVYGYRNLVLNNTTAAAITVTIRRNGGTLDLRQIIVPANSDVLWDFGLPVYHNFDLKASATGVNASFGELI
jgi:hypothetical protein